MQVDRVRMVSMIAPVLLILVALFAWWQSYNNQQSSWSGAGFGMFATIDGEATRHVRGYIEATGQPLSIPESLQKAEFGVRVLPTESRLMELGRSWRFEAGVGDDETLVVEVLGLRFDRSTGRLSQFLIRRAAAKP